MLQLRFNAAEYLLPLQRIIAKEFRRDIFGCLNPAVKKSTEHSICVEGWTYCGNRTIEFIGHGLMVPGIIQGKKRKSSRKRRSRFYK